MTIQQGTAKAVYIADGKTTDFVVPFRFFDNHLAVYKNDDLCSEYMYEIYGAGHLSGGFIAFATPPEKASRITITRRVPLNQEIVFIEGEDFPARDYEYALDKIVMALQEMKEHLERTVAITDTGLLTPNEFYRLINMVYDNFDDIKQIPEMLEIIKKEAATVKSKRYENISVSLTDIVSDETYKDYPYRCDIHIPEATDKDFPAIVFAPEDAQSGLIAPITEADAGRVSFFLKSLPDKSEINIPSLVLV